MFEFLAMNYKGILAATLAAMIIGTIWYAKPVFGANWQKLVGLKERDMQKGAVVAMVIMLLAAFVTAYVMARFIVITNPSSYLEAAKVALWIWLGFVAAQAIGGGVFEKRPYKLIAINIGNQLLTLVVMALIIFGLNS